MNLRVKATALLLAMLATFGFSWAAMADDDDKNPLPGQQLPLSPHHPHPEENELHDRYGDVEQVNLPPLAVKNAPKPGSQPGQAPLNPKPQTLKDAGKADPGGNVPVDPRSIHSHQGTPADLFFNSATIGLGAMGAGVVALGVVAIRRSIKLRKDPKSDFLYQ